MGSFTVNLFEALVSIGISRERAQSLCDLFERGIDERYSLHAQVLATKRDLADLELKLMREMSRSSERIAQTNERVSQTNERISQTNERIAQLETRLRVDIAESKSEIIKWMLGSMFALAGLLITVIKL